MIKDLLKVPSIVEILVFTVIFYLVLRSLRGTRAAAVLRGFVVLVVVGFLGMLWASDLFGLTNLKEMLDNIIPVSLLALVMIFVPEIRRGLSRLQPRLFSSVLHGPPTLIIDELVHAAVRLSKNRIGMLVAIQRDVGLGDFVEQGVRIDSKVSREILESLFYPGSALHDGAVIIQEERLAAGGCLFPLSDNVSSKTMGTRHRAAIGISEITDAITLIVSEETGKISIAEKGKLTTDLSPEMLDKTLRDLYTKTEGLSLPFPRLGQAPAPSADGDGAPPPETKAPTRPVRKKKAEKKVEKKADKKGKKS